MKFHTASETFHEHKNILSARSTVFHAMFTTDMKEKIQGCVDILDLEDDMVRRMLLFLYTGTLKDLHWESALKLYSAADKYQIVALKEYALAHEEDVFSSEEWTEFAKSNSVLALERQCSGNGREEKLSRTCLSLPHAYPMGVKYMTGWVSASGTVGSNIKSETQIGAKIL
ncbi:hypothetical protein TNCV_2126501 [Trichonephila clavipes]|nr:hypothetical protein TNCV_2126501 [Trichonephila clavipes]